MDILNVIEHMNNQEIKEFINGYSTTETTDISEETIATTNEIPETIIENDKNNNTDIDEEKCNSMQDDSREDDEEYDEEYDEDEDSQIYYEDDYKQVCLFYDEDFEIHDEEIMDFYHNDKNFGNWYSAKRIISHSYENNQTTEFFWDYLDKQFSENADDFNNILKVYYKNDLDIDIIYEFESYVAKYFVDNLKIQEYKPKGYIFSGDENQNKWNFKIIVITTKGIYSANRYITNSIIGCY